MQAYSFRLYLEYARAVHPDRDTGVMVRTRLFSLFTPFVERRADLSLERRTTNLALDLHRRARRLKKPRARRRRRSLGLELSNPSRSLPLRKLEQEEESSLVVGHQPSLPNDNLSLISSTLFISSWATRSTSPSSLAFTTDTLSSLYFLPRFFSFPLFFARPRTCNPHHKLGFHFGSTKLFLSSLALS